MREARRNSFVALQGRRVVGWYPYQTTYKPQVWSFKKDIWHC